MSDAWHVEVESIDVEEVVDLDKKRFNSNNHWENDQMPSDYRSVLGQSEAKHWIKSFKTFEVLRIHEAELAWLIKAAKIGQITNKFPRTYEDELNSLVDSHRCDHLFFGGRGFFVRTNTVSLKYGCHGVGPYFDLKSIIESAATCIHGHTPIAEGMLELEFYLMEWVEINPDKEFRMFVCNNRVTCISQQYTTRRNQLLQSYSTSEEREEIARRWADRLCTFWEVAIRPQITHTACYTIDIALLDDEQPMFIEINCFGKEYAAGSSLFHWIIDEEKLYGRNSETTVYFRYAV